MTEKSKFAGQKILVKNDINEEKVIKIEAEEKLLNMIVEFARKEGLTITNIQDVFVKVCEYFESNATLENTTPKSKEQCIKVNLDKKINLNDFLGY